MMVWSSCNSGPELVDRLERGGGLGFDGGREVEVGRGRDGGLRSTAGHGLDNEADALDLGGGLGGEVGTGLDGRLELEDSLGFGGGLGGEVDELGLDYVSDARLVFEGRLGTAKDDLDAKLILDHERRLLSTPGAGLDRRLERVGTRDLGLGRLDVEVRLALQGGLERRLARRTGERHGMPTKRSMDHRRRSRRLLLTRKVRVILRKIPSITTWLPLSLLWTRPV